MTAPDLEVEQRVTPPISRPGSPSAAPTQRTESGVREASEGAGEPPQRVLRPGYDGPAEHGVPGLIDDAHAAFADLLFEAVLSQLLGFPFKSNSSDSLVLIGP